MLCVSLGVSHLDESLETVVVILACLEHNSTLHNLDLLAVSGQACCSNCLPGGAGCSQIC